MYLAWVLSCIHVYVLCIWLRIKCSDSSVPCRVGIHTAILRSWRMWSDANRLTLPYSTTVYTTARSYVYIYIIHHVHANISSIHQPLPFGDCYKLSGLGRSPGEDPCRERGLPKNFLAGNSASEASQAGDSWMFIGSKKIIKFSACLYPIGIEFN